MHSVRYTKPASCSPKAGKPKSAEAGQFLVGRSSGCDKAEQTVGFVGYAGCKEQGVGWSSIGRAVAELQRPETIDGERVTLRVHELAQEITAGIEGIDAAIAEVSNQYVAGELAKIRRR